MDNDAKTRLLDSMRDAWCSNCDRNETLIQGEEELRQAQTLIGNLKRENSDLRMALSKLTPEHLRTRGEP
jgi:hypothetical protein